MKNTRVIAAWFEHQTVVGNYGDSIFTDGTTIFSYKTKLAVREGNGDIVVNMEYYSHTTSKQQSAITEYLTKNGYRKAFNRDPQQEVWQKS